MAPSIAERALEDAPRRVTEAHVAALVKADTAAKQQKAERAVRAEQRRRRIEKERAAASAAARGEKAASAMARVAGAKGKR